MASRKAQRPRGRPRSDRLDAAIHEATLGALAESGYGSLSIEGIAERAGVAKTTVYRRYPSKGALVVAACANVAKRYVAAPDTGSVRGDLVEILSDHVRVLTRTPARRVTRALVAAQDEHPELAKAAALVWKARRRVMIDCLRRGIERGELPDAIDLELAADQLYAPVYYRHLVTGSRLTRAYARQVVDSVLSGLEHRG
jgi:AcrR family transcriptional regulator